ncbi:MAG: translocase, partial [Lentisphaeraceae bacterium]|nr:translocase [Lentisphaeraceae bacterium]
MSLTSSPENTTGSQGKIWRAAASYRKLEDLPKGLDALYYKTGTFFNRRVPRRYLLLRAAAEVLQLEGNYINLTDVELKGKASELREIFLLGRENEKNIHHAFALVREVCTRTLGMRPYKVQVAGGLAIEKGYIAEMATGEGKTLTATMPAVIAGWRGRGCHVMTTNNYLACRDAEEMTPVYEFCGLTVAAMEEGLEPDKRPQAYLADITYCTNKDVAADFLRDQLSCGSGAGGTASLLASISHFHQKENKTTLRGLECAIVDEADSVLIDDGVTPLLISGESDNSELSDAYSQAETMSRSFE